MIKDAFRSLNHRSPTEAPPTLVWKVMARLDQYDRRRQLIRRFLAATTLAVITVFFRRRSRR
ncbi:MAG: hypothetical protein F4Z02_05350 [Acidimicrobiia bacterium]|nr:hypothetical protein [Acidimicrobiia bacterium]MYG72056.1 hypothetical protein [Acidimicrobiia bacterium]